MKKKISAFFVVIILTFNFSFAQSSSTYDNLLSTIKAGIMQATNFPYAAVTNLFRAGEESPNDYAVSGKNPPTYLKSLKDDFDVRQQNDPEKRNSRLSDFFKDMEENPEKYGVKAKKPESDTYSDPDKIETASTDKEQEGKGSEGGTPELPKLPETGGAGQGSEQSGGESGKDSEGKLEAGKATGKANCIALAKDVGEPILQETLGAGYSIIALEPVGEAKVTKVLQSKKTIQKLNPGDDYVANNDFVPITDERKKTCCKKVKLVNDQLVCLESNGTSDNESNLGKTGLKTKN